MHNELINLAWGNRSIFQLNLRTHPGFWVLYIKMSWTISASIWFWNPVLSTDQALMTCLSPPDSCCPALAGNCARLACSLSFLGHFILDTRCLQRHPGACITPSIILFLFVVLCVQPSVPPAQRIMTLWHCCEFSDFIFSQADSMLTPFSMLSVFF